MSRTREDKENFDVFLNRSAMLEHHFVHLPVDRNSLSSVQSELLRELKSEGLTEKHIRSWQSPRFGYHSFTTNHTDALIYLIRVKKMPPQQAMEQISGLDPDQASFLQELYADGLRGEHIRNCQYPRKEFKNELIHFIREKKVSPLQAIEQIRLLSITQIRLLQELYADGLRGEHIRSWQPPRFGWGLFIQKHINAVIHLVRVLHVSPQQAIEQISGLDPDQASLLQELYADGLKGENIRNLKPDSSFTEEQKDAVINLVRVQHVSPQQAIGLTGNEAIDLLATLQLARKYHAK